MKTKGTLLLVVLFLIVADYSLAQGCSQCRIMSEQGVEVDEAQFTNNINYGILWLMIIPYLLLMFLFREKIWWFIKVKILKKG